jgi:hypothetical protein
MAAARPILLPLLCLFLLVLPLSAQDQPGTITGRVFDLATERPLAGVTLTVAQRSTLTGADGRFIVVGMPAGTTRSASVMIGYREEVQSITVQAGQTVSMAIGLTPEAIALEQLVVTGYGTRRAGRHHRFRGPGRRGAVQHRADREPRGADPGPDRRAPGDRLRRAGRRRPDPDPWRYVRERQQRAAVRGGRRAAAHGRRSVGGPQPAQLPEPGRHREHHGPEGRLGHGHLRVAGLERRDLHRDAAGLGPGAAAHVHGLVLVLERATDAPDAVDGAVPDGRERRGAAAHRVPGHGRHRLAQCHPADGHGPGALGGPRRHGRPAQLPAVPRDTWGRRASSGARGRSGCRRRSSPATGSWRTGSTSGRTCGAPARRTSSPRAAASAAATIFDPTQPIRTDDGYFEQRAFVLGPNNPIAELDPAVEEGSRTGAWAASRPSTWLPFVDNLTATARMGYDVASSERKAFYPSTLWGQEKGREPGLPEPVQPAGDHRPVRPVLHAPGALRRPATWRPRRAILTRPAAATTRSSRPWAWTRTSWAPAACRWPTSSARPSSSRSAGWRPSSPGPTTRCHDRYLFTASVRRDGSSRFGPDNQWGTFPAAAFAWRLSEESFMQGSTASRT